LVTIVPSDVRIAPLPEPEAPFAPETRTVTTAGSTALDTSLTLHRPSFAASWRATTTPPTDPASSPTAAASAINPASGRRPSP